MVQLFGGGQMTENDETIGLAEAGVRLRLPYQNVHRLLLIGELRGEKVGSRWRVRVEDVDRLAHEQSQEEQPA